MTKKKELSKNTRSLNIKRFNINDLIPAEYNPRKATDKQEKDLQKSLKKFGVVEPVIVNINNNRKNIIIGLVGLIFISAIFYTFWAFSNNNEEEYTPVDTCVSHLNCSINEDGYLTAENMDRNTTFADFDRCIDLSPKELPQMLCLEE
jgi:hypothetical protein